MVGFYNPKRLKVTYSATKPELPRKSKCCCRGQSVSRAENRKHSSCGVVEQGLVFTRTPKICRINKPFIGIGPLFYLLFGGLGRVWCLGLTCIPEPYTIVGSDPLIIGHNPKIGWFMDSQIAALAQQPLASQPKPKDAIPQAIAAQTLLLKP